MQSVDLCWNQKIRASPPTSYLTQTQEIELVEPVTARAEICLQLSRYDTAELILQWAVRRKKKPSKSNKLHPSVLTKFLENHWHPELSERPRQRLESARAMGASKPRILNWCDGFKRFFDEVKPVAFTPSWLCRARCFPIKPQSALSFPDRRKTNQWQRRLSKASSVRQPPKPTEFRNAKQLCEVWRQK